MKKSQVARNIIGPGLRRLRNERGLTQAQLAEFLQRKGWDISRETLAKIEAQLRWLTDFEVAFLLNALGVELVELLPRSGRQQAILDFINKHEPTLE